MSVAPEPFLSGYLSVLRYAILMARNWAGADGRNEKLADLMDAVHNIPELLNRWEECDEPSLRSALKHYDVRWAESERDMSLCGLLDGALEMGAKQERNWSSMKPNPKKGTSAR